MDPFHVSAIFGFELRKLSPPRSVTMVFTALVPVLMRETRGGVVLTRIAKRLRKKSGDLRYRARIEDERASLKTLIWISSTRPLCRFIRCYVLCIANQLRPPDFVLTEPVVASFSVRLPPAS